VLSLMERWHYCLGLRRVLSQYTELEAETSHDHIEGLDLTAYLTELGQTIHQKSMVSYRSKRQPETTVRKTTERMTTERMRMEKMTTALKWTQNQKLCQHSSVGRDHEH
jgi:hypothetical protein